MKTRISVLHLIHTLELGGAEKFLLTTARALKDHVDVKVCSMYGRDHLLEAFKSENIPVTTLNRKNKFNPFIIFELSKIIKSERPDLIHTHLFFATIYGRIAARMHGVPVITTEHNESNWRRGNWLVKIAYRLTTGKQTRIVAISDAVKSALIEKGHIPASKIIVIKNGISCDTFPGPKKNPRTDDEQTFLVGSVGRLDFRKGYDVLLHAVAHLKSTVPGIKCLLVGDGKEREKLRKLAAELHIEDRVTFAGYQFEVQPFLAEMDVFVSPSRSEGFGLAILEAMAAGCPVVASNVGGIPEIIEDGVNGMLVSPEESEALAAAILKLRDRALAQTLSKNAQKQVATKFSQEDNIHKILQEYQKLF